MDTAVAFGVGFECAVGEGTCMEFDFLGFWGGGLAGVAGCNALMAYLDMDSEALFGVECCFAMGTYTVIETLAIFHMIVHCALDAFSDPAC